MNVKDLINAGLFKPNEEEPSNSSFEISVFLPGFKKEVKVVACNLVSLDLTEQMSYVAETVNSIISFGAKDYVWLKEVIWKHYESCISNISYAMVDSEGGDNEIDANRKYFNISSPSEAFSLASLEVIWFDVSFLGVDYFNLHFSCPWETEHGVMIGISEGKLDYYE
ncbi:hypothetical protein D1Z90_10295 [Motilimonas pumila]|uniref:DUF6985 domain-containing protein n=1 Tax=Motilimonas pumila TaxID=2303987 RepID=A0A418YEI3_9GAMM|nr:hypothetical protein D1Z90_10295 [Motilimonas pumila]